MRLFVSGKIEDVQLKELGMENEILRAKTEALHSEQHKEELYKKAIEAMRSYAPLKEYAELTGETL